jgi:hypothetical protein
MTQVEIQNQLINKIVSYIATSYDDVNKMAPIAEILDMVLEFEEK